MSTAAPQSPAKKVGTIEVVAVEGKSLDTICYRGVAPITDLAAISQADVFDQVSNPGGLQRDLSPKHASEAYNYVAREEDEEFPRAFPEVILNVRDEHVVSAEPINLGRQKGLKAVKFTFDLDSILDDLEKGKVAVSRVDGNHRLYYALGDGRREPLDAEIPFQLHVGLSPEQEANLFVDINAEQKGLNSSHLHFLRSRLTPEEQEMRDHPERVFARRLAEDKESPWFGLVYMGGSRKGSKAEGHDRPISFVTLEQGVRRTLSKSQYIHDLNNPDAQYVLLRNFWQAVKTVFNDEWEGHKNYLLLKNIGVLAFSIMGGTVIDRCVARAAVEVDEMVPYLEQVTDTFNWSKDATGDGSVSGMSGNRAALLIAGELTSNLVDPGESKAIMSIQERLLAAEKEAAEAAPGKTPADQEWSEQPDVSDLEKVGVHRSVEAA